MLWYVNCNIFLIEDDFVYFDYEFGLMRYKKFDLQVLSVMIGFSKVVVESLSNIILVFVIGIVYVVEILVFEVYVDCIFDLIRD